MMILLGMILGGAAFRIRGWSGFGRITGRGATTARVFWGACMGLLAWASWAPGVVALALAAGLFLGALPGWYRSLSLGRAPQDRPALGAYLRHFLRGVAWTLPAGVLAGAMAWWLGGSAWPAVLVGASGVLCVPAYEVGWRLRPMWDARSPGATEIGEALFGAAIGAAIGAGGLLL